MHLHYQLNSTQTDKDLRFKMQPAFYSYPCRQHTLYAGIVHTLQDKYVSFVRGYFRKHSSLVSTHYAPLPELKYKQPCSLKSPETTCSDRKESGLRGQNPWWCTLFSIKPCEVETWVELVILSILKSTEFVVHRLHIFFDANSNTRPAKIQHMKCY